MKSGGYTCFGSAAEKNSGLRESAATIVSPASRASADSSGNCSLCFACADWWPDVTLPARRVDARADRSHLIGRENARYLQQHGGDQKK